MISLRYFFFIDVFLRVQKFFVVFFVLCLKKMLFSLVVVIVAGVFDWYGLGKRLILYYGICSSFEGFSFHHSFKMVGDVTFSSLYWCFIIQWIDTKNDLENLFMLLQWMGFHILLMIRAKRGIVKLIKTNIKFLSPSKVRDSSIPHGCHAVSSGLHAQHAITWDNSWHC